MQFSDMTPEEYQEYMSNLGPLRLWRNYRIRLMYWLVIWMMGLAFLGIISLMLLSITGTMPDFVWSALVAAIFTPLLDYARRWAIRIRLLRTPLIYWWLILSNHYVEIPLNYVTRKSTAFSVVEVTNTLTTIIRDLKLGLYFSGLRYSGDLYDLSELNDSDNYICVLYFTDSSRALALKLALQE